MQRSRAFIMAAAALVVGFAAGRLTAPSQGRLRPSEERAARALLPVPRPAFPAGQAAGQLAFGPRFRGQPAVLLPVGDKAAVVAAFAEGAARDDPGLVRVVYLVPGRRGWVPGNGQAASVASGAFGQAGTVTLRRDLGALPIVQVEGGGPTAKGCTAHQFALIELAPDRPRLLVQGLAAARAPAPGSGEGAYAGQVVNEGDHLAVHYTGAAPAKVALRRTGDQLRAVTPPPPGC